MKKKTAKRQKNSAGELVVVVPFKLGDVVQLNKFWQGRVGIVTADDTAWHVLIGHWALSSNHGNCIFLTADVIRVIKAGAVAKEFLQYL